MQHAGSGANVHFGTAFALKFNYEYIVKNYHSHNYAHERENAINVRLRSLLRYRSSVASAIASLRTRKFAHVHSLIQTSYVYTFKPHIIR